MRDLQEKPAINGSETQRKTQVMSMDESLAGWLCYTPFVGIVCSIIWLATEPSDSKFVRFHAIQAVALCVVSFAGSIGLSILGAFGLRLLTAPVSMLFSLVMFGAWILCLFNAGKHRMFKLPFIGDFAEEKA